VSDESAPVSDPGEVVSSVDDLVALFHRAETPPEEWRVGTEHEKIGLRTDGLDPVPYEGEFGIGAFLERIADVDGWQRVLEDGAVIALEKDRASITLEPGGQLELSGAPLRTIHETCDEFHTHLALMKEIAEPFGILWLGLGINPLHPLDRIPIMPKERYRIMRSYMPTRGSRGLVMMFQTATVQANFDYTDEADMVDKMRIALAASPIVSAIFANSSISDGAANGFISARMRAWEDTDPDRTGMLPFAFDEGFGYRRYAEWAVDVPMYFILNGDRYDPGDGRTFRQFMEGGGPGRKATLADWNRHLGSVFPDVRLKNVIEVRGADAVPSDLTCSLPALWKGLFYDADARAAARDLLGAMSPADLGAGRGDVARRGLAAELAGRPVLALATELVEISRAGLRRIGHAGRTDSDETGYLEPVAALLERGASPGEVVLERWEGEWGRSVDRLIDYARY
jgi:glutamate--cysteine ligase